MKHKEKKFGEIVSGELESKNRMGQACVVKAWLETPAAYIGVPRTKI